MSRKQETPLPSPISKVQRCEAHPYSLLTTSGLCPRCIHETDAARARTVDEEREARWAQSIARTTRRVS